MKYIILLFAFGILSSCSKSPEPLVVDLMNCYKEVESDEFIQFAGSNHRFCFEDDNFLHLEISYWTDALNLNDPCPESRVEIIEGTYILGAENLTIEADIIDILVNGESVDCPKGPFDTTYVVEQNGVDDLILNPDLEGYYQIRLEKE